MIIMDGKYNMLIAIVQVPLLHEFPHLNFNKFD